MKSLTQWRLILEGKAYIGGKTFPIYRRIKEICGGQCRFIKDGSEGLPANTWEVPDDKVQEILQLSREIKLVSSGPPSRAAAIAPRPATATATTAKAYIGGNTFSYRNEIRGICGGQCRFIRDNSEGLPVNTWEVPANKAQEILRLSKDLKLISAAKPQAAPEVKPEAKPEAAKPEIKQPETPGRPESRPLRKLLFEDKGTIEVDDPNLLPDAEGKRNKILQRLKIMYVPGQKLDDAERNLRIQMINYNFESVQREKENTGGYGNFRIVYYVSGTYDQFVFFGRLLKKYGFETAEYRKIFDAKFGTKQPDGRIAYPAKIEGDPPAEFVAGIQEQFPNLGYELYEAQRQGVAFLYGRRRAILGDETGVGKTVQLIAAAELKMRETNKGDCLIITLKDTRKQWEDEISNLLGEEGEANVSHDALAPKRYTILYYAMFSPASEKARYNAEKAVDSLINHKFQIVIFDELHKVKHADAAKSQNLFKVIQSIPIKWGATATLSANKAEDVRNQLRMIGHTLGFMDKKRFKQDFAGVKRRGKRLSPEEKFKNQVRAAENLNRWLHIMEIYVRRRKKDIRADMPNVHIGESRGSFDPDLHLDFTNKFQTRVDRMANPIPIAVLGAARLELAVAKANANGPTVKRVTELVKEGKRVVVFTTFIESARLLKDNLTESIHKINPNWHILTFLSDDKPSSRRNVKEIFSMVPDKNPYRVLLMSIKMGGTGIDFPNAATHMVINDYDWTPESCEQSEGRIYRINTNQDVHIEYVIAQGTIDEQLFEKVQEKRKLAARIQKWRKDYQDELEPKRANAHLEQIVQAQMQIRRIDNQIADIAGQVAGGRGSYGESLTFKNYVNYNEVGVFDED